MFSPGRKAWWMGDDGIQHPVTVKFQCCEASTPDFYQIVDEFGWGHLVYGNRLAPRDSGLDYVSRPAGKRLGE